MFSAIHPPPKEDRGVLAHGVLNLSLLKRAKCAAVFECMSSESLKFAYCRIYVDNYIVFYFLENSYMVAARFLYSASDYRKKLK